jgi:alkyl hydroperoxide reductase subunit AhpC
MLRKKHTRIRWYAGVVLIFSWVSTAQSESNISSENIYPVGKLKPRDSIPVLEIGDQAPDFTLPAVSGEKVSLGDYRGKKNVVISFVPAAFTPVCSMQWPVYNLTKDIFDKNGAMLLGITVDNIPSLYAWTSQMVEGEDKVWFPVLSDFNPHGEVAKKYGVLRSEGFSERALFVVDKKGIIRYIDIHDINERPSLRRLVKALEEVNR